MTGWSLMPEADHLYNLGVSENKILKCWDHSGILRFRDSPFPIRHSPFTIHYLFLLPFSHIVECRSVLGVYPINTRCNLTNQGFGADGNPLPCRYWPLISANAVAFVAFHLVAFGKHQRIFHVGWITCKHLAQAGSHKTPPCWCFYDQLP